MTEQQNCTTTEDATAADAARDIREIRQNCGRPRLNDYQVQERVVNLVLVDLTNAGTFYNDHEREAYLFLREERRLLRIGPDDRDFQQALVRRSGLLSTERITRHVVEALRQRALQAGTPTTVHHLAHYDRQRRVLYWSNFADRVYRITADEMSLVDNGTDGVLFLRPPDCVPFELHPAGDLAQAAARLRPALVDGVRLRDGVLTALEQAELLLLYVVALLFCRPMPIVPAFIGPRGSGKTCLARRLGRLLLGPRFRETSLRDQGPADFNAAITNTDFFVADNVDEAPRWFGDALAAAVTGAVSQRRTLYTTNDVYTSAPRACIAVTARTPTFRREDVASRLLPVHLDPLPQRLDEESLVEHWDARREELLSLLVPLVQGVLREDCRELGPVPVSIRMGNFARIAQAAGRALGWLQVSQLLPRLEETQFQFTAEDDPLCLIVRLWLASGNNIGRWVTTGKLALELSELAGTRGLRELGFQEGNVRSLGHALTNQRATLTEMFGFEERDARSNVRQVRFTRPGTVIDGDN